MKKFTKILSVLCALALIVSCIGVGFVASAAEATMSFTEKEDFDAQTSYDAYGTNHLATASVSAKATEIIDGVATPAGSWTPGTGLTDNSPAAQQMIKVTWPSGAITDNAAAAKDYTSTNKYLDYTFALPSGINNPEMVLLAFVQKGTNVNWNNEFFDCRHWAIYASDKADTLFEGEPIYYRQQSGQTAPEYKIDISALELKNVKYLGVRVYNFYFWGNTVLFSEIGLYGGEAAPSARPISNGAYTSSNNSYSSYGPNHLNGSTITPKVVANGVEGTVTFQSWAGPLTNLVNNSSSDFACYTATNIGAPNYGATAPNSYFDFDFKLSATVNNPEKFLMAHKTDGGDISHNWYAVYIGSTKAELDSSDPVFVWKNQSGTSNEQIFDISSLKLQNVKYLRVRYYHLSNNYVIKTREIALYGGTAKNPVSTKTTLSGDYSSLGANAFANSTMTYGAKLDDGTGFGNLVPNFALLTDNNSANENHSQTATWEGLGSVGNTTQKSEYLEIKFALASPISNPTTILAAFRADYSSQHFEVFASETEADLYNNSVFEYVSGSRCAEVYIDIAGSVKTAKYFAFRFYELPSASYLLLFELGLYGGKTVFQANGEPASDNYEARFGANHLTNGTFTTTAYIGGSTVACSSTFGPQINDNLWSTGRAMAQTANSAFNADNNAQGQKNAYYEVTFTLNSAVNNPETVLLGWENTVSNADEPNKTYESQHYEIFASSDLASLYNNSVFEHENYSELGREHIIDISGNNLKNIKYFGVRFYHRPLWNNIVIATEIGLYTPPKASDVSIDLVASVFSNTAPGSGDANDIQYKLNKASANKFEVIDAGLISGFKVNIDADSAFNGDYTEYLKTSANNSAIAKISIPAELLGSSEIYFHHTNSGTHNGNDYSAYKVCSIGFVVIKDGEGTEHTIYSNLIDKSSMQISRNQAKSYKEKGYNIAEYAAYDFANDGNIDIAVVRNYVKAAADVALFEEVSNIKIVNDGVLNSGVKTQGRAYALTNSLGVDNAAAGFEFNAYCQGDVSITVNCNGENSLDSRGPKFVVVVDGKTTYDVTPSAISGDVEIVLATGLAKGNHSFAVYRMTPSKCDVKTINLKGKLIAAPEAKDLKIAFVGDSITVGHYSVINAAMTNGQTITDWDGSKIASTKVVVYDSSNNVVGTYSRSNVQFANNNIYVEDAGAGIDLTYSLSSYSFQYKFYDANGAFLGEFAKNQKEGTAYTNSYDTYAVKTAKALNADWDVLGMTGNKIESVVSANNIFTTTYRGASAYDLKADIFVINMATNSMYSGTNATAYGNAMATAVTQIRAKNPDAKIVFAYGSMRNDDVTKYYDSTWTAGSYNITEHHENIRNKATSLNTTYGDIYSFGFSRAMREGGAAHPSMAEQGEMAQELAAFINTIK